MRCGLLFPFLVIVGTAGAKATFDPLHLLVTRQDLPSLANSTIEGLDKNCLESCTKEVLVKNEDTYMKCYKIEDRVEQAECVCKAPFFAPVKDCIKTCATDEAADESIKTLDQYCAQISGNSASPRRVPAVAYALIGLTVIMALPF